MTGLVIAAPVAAETIDRVLAVVAGQLIMLSDVTAVRELGMTYGRFISGLKTAGIEIDRKVLADIAVRDPAAFKVIADQARAANEGTA